MKVAAYQSPLFPAGSFEALGSIRARVRECEDCEVSILCCPEAVLGGLADYDGDPSRFALHRSRLDSVLTILASNSVTSIIGFTEIGDDRRLYNSAAVFHRGSTLGVYRKLQPEIHRSICRPGAEAALFQIESLTFGIVICNDSNFPECTGTISAQGATVLFIPTNNALPHGRTSDDPGPTDAKIARDTHMWVVRADVAGSTKALNSRGYSEILDPEGKVVQSALPMQEALLVATVAYREE